jgi:hypothetical protein
MNNLSIQFNKFIVIFFSFNINNFILKRKGKIFQKYDN